MVFLIGLGRVVEALYVFFAPGFAWSFVFFYDKKDLDWISRIVLSAAISIGSVTLTVFWLSWVFHVRISEPNVCLIAGGLTLLAIGWLVVRKPDFRSRLWEKLRSPFGSVSDKSDS